MTRPKILVFAGSIRTGSHNARLAALATKLLALADAEPSPASRCRIFRCRSTTAISKRSRGRPSTPSSSSG